MILLEILGALFLISIPIAAIEGLTLAWIFVGVIVAAVIVSALRARQ